VPARWWEDLKGHCVPPCRPRRVEPSGLGKCWLPDLETIRAIGPFLPAIDLDAFGEDRAAVESWLRQTVGLRTHLNQVSPSEWTDLLNEAIPTAFRDVGPEDREVQRSVHPVYEAALDSLAGQQRAWAALVDVPWVCRRNREWNWVPGTEKR